MVRGERPKSNINIADVGSTVERRLKRAGGRGFSSGNTGAIRESRPGDPSHRSGYRASQAWRGRLQANFRSPLDGEAARDTGYLPYCHALELRRRRLD